jgi:enoyl-CoA hydratase
LISRVLLIVPKAYYKIISMSYTTLITSIDNSIFTITINRPEKLNALNSVVLSELELAIEEIYTNASIKSAIITGTGPKAFVAGADISAFSDLTKTEAINLSKRGQDIYFKIENSSKPIIAAVNGFALGGGCELAMACHFRIAAENAKFGQPEINLGIVPGYGGTQRLTKLIGKGRAIELLISGIMIDAQTALQYGLVNYVVPQELLMDKAISILTVINTKAPIAITECIKSANAAENNAINGYTVENNAFGESFDTADRKEGTFAFLENRTPKFIGE